MCTVVRHHEVTALGTKSSSPSEKEEVSSKKDEISPIKCWVTVIGGGVLGRCLGQEPSEWD